LAIVLAGVVVVAAVLSAQAAVHISLVSRATGGAPANGYSTLEGNGGTISHDGRIVGFESNAANLPGGDGVIFRAYVRDMDAGETLLVSKTSNGVPATGEVFNTAVSANGRFSTFAGTGTGLPGANGKAQTWVHDLRTGRTRLASAANNGDPADDHASYPSLSASGRYVAFESKASNLPGGDGSTTVVYIRDTKKKKTILASRTNAGDPASGDLYGQPVSTDGRLVAFRSNDADLPGGDGSTYHAYVRDRRSGKVRLIDRGKHGHIGNDTGGDVSITGNGRFATFDSEATNLPGGSAAQSYLRDLKRGKTKLVSQNSGGHPQDQYSLYAHASEDGRYVAFYSDGSNLPGGDGSTDQIYVRDVAKGKTRLISRAANGDPGDDDSEYASISAGGHYVSFYGYADNLGGSPTNQNVFRAGPLG
jgi:Tol biopolymer transport system component